MVEETLIHRANKGVYGGDVDGRWKYDWYRPVKPVENSHGSEISDPLAGISSENKETSYYSFRYKRWMRDTGVETMEQDPPVLLKLADYDRVKIAQAKKKMGKKNNTDDLSEDAIRGAVGGSDSVFSSSHAKPETATNRKQEEVNSTQDAEKKQADDSKPLESAGTDDQDKLTDIAQVNNDSTTTKNDGENAISGNAAVETMNEDTEMKDIETPEDTEPSEKTANTEPLEETEPTDVTDADAVTEGTEVADPEANGSKEDVKISEDSEVIEKDQESEKKIVEDAETAEKEEIQQTKIDDSTQGNKNEIDKKEEDQDKLPDNGSEGNVQKDEDVEMQDA
ncbi:hypothetical protein RNJ44_03424 [Nakaseomyces bracarensis]|uniref:Uncharacterized protein n=1 Tax=Nakaseomyces bracarensis TaxID=273131 RepID=A0ABR4NX03_9SACH